MNASIRNIALASGLTLLSILGLSTTVQAQTTTGSTSLQVTITNNCTFVNTPTGLAESVTSYSAIATKTLTSSLTVSCNGNNFFVNAKSANGGVLKDINNVITTTIPYTVATSNDTMGSGTFFAAAPLTTSDTVIVTKNGYSSSCAATTGCSANLTWALSAPSAGLPIGVYKDTITYTLSAN